MDSMAYSQGVGSVPYGLPCLAVTRRNQTQQYQQYELERVNVKLCQIMRVPADYVDVEKDSDDSYSQQDISMSEEEGDGDTSSEEEYEEYDEEEGDENEVNDE